MLLCDMDFRPCQRLITLAGIENGFTFLLAQASVRLNWIVRSAFEAMSDVDIGNDDPGAAASRKPERAVSEDSDDDDSDLDELWWLNILSVQSRD